MRTTKTLLLFPLFFLSAFLWGDAPSVPNPIVFTSDFGTQDDGVAIVKGIILTIEPQAKIVDLTHSVPAFSVRDAGRFVANTAPHFPKGSVFLTLVDRNVGAPKKPIVMRSKKGHYFVQPDNGIITLVADRDGIEEMREISGEKWVTKGALGAGHAWRDVYAPVAAHLARGEAFSQVGPILAKSFRLNLEKFKVDSSGIKGEVIALDGPFGNLITNITSASILGAGYTLGDKIQITIGTKSLQVPFVKTFDDVPVNELLLYVDSTDHVALAINQGNFASKHKIKPPQKISIPKAQKK